MFNLTSKYNLKLHREHTGQINKDNIKTPLCSTFAFRYNANLFCYQNKTENGFRVVF